MKFILNLILLFAFTQNSFLSAQEKKIDSILFFNTESIINVELSTDLKKLQTEKEEDVFQPATIKMDFEDGISITEKITIAARGQFRRNYCRIPPMMMNFRNPESPLLHQLGKLKLVIGCGNNSKDEELLLREFLVYKIYNMLEDKSFRVRLLKLNCTDSKEKVKGISQYAFLIEDDADMARRNACRKKEEVLLQTEETDREVMTKVAIFQYMIGNTDWAVINNHNVKLIYDKINKEKAPFVVPYDFDYCGLVNAGYAVPNEALGIESVKDRVYRGYVRTFEELQQTLNQFRGKKDSIYSYIRTFPYLTKTTKKDIINYLDEFFRMTIRENEIRFNFIENARKN